MCGFKIICNLVVHLYGENREKKRVPLPEEIAEKVNILHYAIYIA
jgi:hypothetical protein